jgi:8-oxo-dGTP diphosphatase
MILHTIERYYTWALIAILLLNLAQRKIPNTNKKRVATIYLASILLLFEIGVLTILNRGLNHNWAWLAFAAVVVLLYLLRRRALPFRLHCSQCGKRLSFKRIIGGDENTCTECYTKAHPEEVVMQQEIEGEEDPYRAATTVDQIDWEAWEPTNICVLTFLFDEHEQVLLIDKKTGLGSGLVNAPGGHIEEDETARDAAVREFKEETGLDVTGLSMQGTLHFQFTDGIRLRGYVFFATGHSGEMIETEEARPFWVKISDIPYEKMWEDDRYWLPPALEGKLFEGFFIFDDKLMVDKRLHFEEA